MLYSRKDTAGIKKTAAVFADKAASIFAYARWTWYGSKVPNAEDIFKKLCHQIDYVAANPLLACTKCSRLMVEFSEKNGWMVSLYDPWPEGYEAVMGVD